MNSDCAYWIGKTHRVCEDYATVRVGEEGCFVVLADGCSSSPDTDIGARLLAKSAECLLPSMPLVVDADWNGYHEKAVRHAADCGRSLGLSADCLDATLLTIAARGSAFVATCYGDGLVALGRRDGRLELFSVTFAGGYPQYASYLLDEPRRRRWEATPANGKQVEHWTLGEDGVEDLSLCRSERSCEVFQGSAADYRFVAVLSDGAASFAETVTTETSLTTQSVAVTDVLPRLLAFKGSQGQFVQRRVQGFGRDCQARHWIHRDDVSLGVVWLGD